MRPSIDNYFMNIAEVVASRGTCIRRKVGVVLVNSRHHIIATGYNGPASGQPHCIEFPCSGAIFKSGEGLADCEALHAEQNSLCQCHNIYDIDTIYTTTSPCVMCTKLLLGTSCNKIIFKEEYADAAKSAILWQKNNRRWVGLHRG